MPSLFRFAIPVTLKLSSPSHQFSPHASPLSKRTKFTVVIAATNNSPASQATSTNPPPISHPKEIKPIADDAQPLPLLTRPLPLCDINHDTVCNATPNRDPSRNTSVDHCSVANTAHALCSSFPVLGPFDLLHCLQDGSFGAAWAANDRSTGRLLCLKVFQSLQDQDVTRSVQTELRMFRRMVKSKGGERGKQFIMELNRSIQHDTNVFFAMELMTTDLGTYMWSEPDRCSLHARRWMAQIALGIESLHEMGILHRDIKAENILIDSRENVRIIDFGLSYMDPSGLPLLKGFEYANNFVGTLQYMAPEVLQNKDVPAHLKRRYGTMVDWWGLGCILFELESWDHQTLFDTEEDVYAYVDWTEKPRELGETYPSFVGIDPMAVNLLEGLLRVHPSVRLSLNDMEKHVYFLHSDGTSEFENAAARALQRPVRSELVPKFGDHRPVKVVEAAKLSSIYDWTNLKSAHLVDG